MIVVDECLKKKIDKKQFNNILSKHFGTIRGGEVYRIVQKIVGDATIDKVMSVPVRIVQMPQILRHNRCPKQR